jgi:hypothetical protein
VHATRAQEEAENAAYEQACKEEEEGEYADAYGDADDGYLMQYPTQVALLRRHTRVNSIKMHSCSLPWHGATDKSARLLVAPVVLANHASLC